MEIQTTDGTFVGRGSRVLCYYATPVQYGTITEIDGAGWADVEHDDGTRGYYDGDRLAFKAPASGPAAIGPDPRTPGYAGTPTLGALVDGTFGR